MNDLIRAHCAWLRAGGLSRRTVDARQYWLERADSELPFGVAEADRAELEGFLTGPVPDPSDPEDLGWAPATRAKAHYHLSQFFVWGVDPVNAVDAPILADNPMIGIRRPKVPGGESNPVSDEELAIVLAEAREPYVTAVILACGAGLRCSELSRVRREDITEDRVWVRFGKGGKSAPAPAFGEVWAHVSDFPRGRVIEHVGGISDGRKMSARASIYFSRTLKLPGVSLHRFRHKYAELLRRGGNDIATISRCLRHKHLSSTQVYARATEAECRFAVSTLRLREQTPN